MRYITTSAEMQKIDQMTIQGIGIPGMVLMEKAALKMHDMIVERFSTKEKICIVAGTGNNGGDGLALGRMLVESGYQVAIMAPTAILATQHLESFKQMLEQFDIKCELLISSITP